MLSLAVVPDLGAPRPLQLQTTYRFLGPVTVCWSHPAPESLPGGPTHSPQMLIQHRRPFVPQPCTFFKKKSAFHFNDDTTQRWGSCYHTEGIWAEVIGVVKLSNGGIFSFLHKFPMCNYTFQEGMAVLNSCWKGKFISLLIQQGEGVGKHRHGVFCSC